MITAPLSLSIGLGLLIGLLFVEFFGLAVGGMVVPGYIALEMDNPGAIIVTLITALIVYSFVALLSKFFLVYGRRRIALMVLSAFVLGNLIEKGTGSIWAVSTLGEWYHVVGHIIPGLIAISIDRQGILETFSTLLTASAIVRLLLILLIGPSLLP